MRGTVKIACGGSSPPEDQVSNGEFHLVGTLMLDKVGACSALSHDGPKENNQMKIL